MTKVEDDFRTIMNKRFREMEKELRIEKRKKYIQDVFKGFMMALMESYIKESLSKPEDFNELLNSSILNKPENKKIINEFLREPGIFQIIEKFIGQQNTQKLIQYTDYKDTNEDSKDTNEDRSYDILGISPSITNDDIKKAYKEKIQEYHPDKASQTTNGIKELAKEMCIQINWAYEYLKKKRNFK